MQETRSAPQESSAPGRLNFIEGLRGLAAFYVVLQHICTMIDPHRKMARPGAQPEWLAQVMGGLWFGGLAVAGFIVISGFCLQLSLFNRGDGSRTDWRKFFARRCWRILPPYYACLALSLVVCWLVTQHQSGLPWVQYLPVTAENLTAHLLMVHNLQPEWMYKINGVLWSISIEFQLYFFFPLFVWLLHRAGRGVLMIVLSGLAAWLLISYAPAAKLYVHFIPLFGLGMVAASVAFRPDARKLPSWVWAGLSVMALVATVIACRETKEAWIRDSLCGISLAALLTFCAQKPGSMLSRALGVRTLVGLGAFSYSLYLMHHPILQVLFAHRPEWASTVTRQFAYLVALIPLILLLCWLFYLAFERPFIKPRRAQKGPISEPVA